MPKSLFLLFLLIVGGVVVAGAAFKLLALVLPSLFFLLLGYALGRTQSLRSARRRKQLEGRELRRISAG